MDSMRSSRWHPFSLACAVVAAAAAVGGGWLQHPLGGATVFAVLTVTALDTGWRLASSWLTGCAPSQRIAAALLLFEAIAAGTVTLLGSFGVLSVPGVATAIAVLHAVAVRTGRSSLSLRDLLGEVRFGSGANPLADACLLAVLVVLAFVAMLQVRFVVQDADSMWYHLVMAGEWVRTGSIAPIDAIPLIGVGYPGFRQALIAFLALPFGNEHLALLGVLEFPLLVLSIYTLARTFGCGRSLALAGGLYGATTPVVMGALSTQGNDLSLAIHLLLAVLFLGRFFADGDRRQAVLAGLALGALASIKFSGPGYAVIALLVALVQYGWRRLRPGAGALLLLVGALALALPWYLRNLLAFGNPLYPARVQLGGQVLFDGPLGADYFARDRLGWDVGPLLDNLHHFPDAHGWLVPLVALGPLLAALAVRRAAPRRPLLGLALLPVLLFVAFLHHPFNRPWVEAGAGYTHRYLVVWFTASTVAVLVGLARLPARVFWVLLFLGAAFVGLSAITHWVPILVGSVVAASLVSFWFDVPALLDRWLERLLRVRMRAGLLLLACIAATWSLARYRGHQQYDPVCGYHDAASERGWGPVVAWVHQHVHGARVGLHGSLYMFPLLGEPWSNEVFLADDLHLDVPRRSVADVAAWARDRHLDYLVCCVPRLSRTGSRDYVFGNSIAAELLTLAPGEFEQVFASRGAAVLQVHRGDGR
ncbi:MAG: hypothetical protein JNM25_18380 [Planctomycetes bacterium]|nr:hypothetical protein [Planctomycetota bacterium]